MLREAERKDGRWIDLEMWAKLRPPDAASHMNLREAGPGEKEWSRIASFTRSIE